MRLTLPEKQSSRSYQAAPSFAYIIGEYTLDRNGVLTGPRNSQLMLTLDQDGYRTK